MTTKRELPVIIDHRIASDPRKLAKSIMQDLDHIIGETRYVADGLQRMEGLAGEVRDIAIALPPTGGTFIEDITAILDEAGVGQPDGDVPTSAPGNVKAVGGIGNWFIVYWDTIDNNSGVYYDVHVSSVTGFTPAPNTLVGTWANPGQSGGVGAFTVRTFPAGHTLFGTAYDPVNADRTYYVKVVSRDDDGEGLASSQATVTPLKVSADSIVAAGTVVANLIAGSTITGDKIAGATITADKMNVGTLSAITANVGLLTAGTIQGILIQGAIIRSTTGSNYVELSPTYGSAIQFFSGGTQGPRITGTASMMSLAGPNIADSLQISNNLVEVPVSGDLKVTGALWVGTASDEPPTGYVVLYKDANNLMAKAPGRAAVVVVAL